MSSDLSTVTLRTSCSTTTAYLTYLLAPLREIMPGSCFSVIMVLRRGGASTMDTAVTRSSGSMPRENLSTLSTTSSPSMAKSSSHRSRLHRCVAKILTTPSVIYGRPLRTARRLNGLPKSKLWNPKMWARISLASIPLMSPSMTPVAVPYAGVWPSCAQQES